MNLIAMTMLLAGLSGPASVPSAGVNPAPLLAAAREVPAWRSPRDTRNVSADAPDRYSTSYTDFKQTRPAKAAKKPKRAAAADGDEGSLVPAHWPGQPDLLDFCSEMGPGTAAILILAGVIYLLFGITLFKALIVLNATVAGAVVGAAMGEPSGATVPAALAGAVLLAAVTWPLMKWAVAVMGAVFGAMLAATAWRLAALDPAFTWAGALTGLVAGGLMCFILFRGCVVTYTSLQGSVMIIFGVLGLLFKYQTLAPQVGGYLSLKPFVLPICIFIPMVIGIFYQQSGKPKPAGAAPAGGGSAPKK